MREGGESGKREDGKVIPPRIKLGASPHEIPPIKLIEFFENIAQTEWGGVIHTMAKRRTKKKGTKENK